MSLFHKIKNALTTGSEEVENKQQFRDELKASIDDNRLDRARLSELAKKRAALGLGTISGETMFARVEAYEHAVANALAEGKVTELEMQELARLQEFLRLPDDQVAKSKVELQRFRLMAQIQAGQMPCLSPGNVALKGAHLKEGEVPHWVEPGEYYREPSPKPGGTGAGVPVAKGVVYRAGSSRAYQLPLKNATAVAAGNIILTSQRVIFNGNPYKAVVYENIDEVNMFPDGFRVVASGVLTLFRIKALDKLDFMGLIMSHYLNPGDASLMTLVSWDTKPGSTGA